jgi:hypothetical protein
VPQSNIAFWEQSEKPPRSDLLPQMADALGVTVVELLNVNGEISVAKRSTNKPPGKVRKVFEDVSRLPRRQQEHIVRVVSALVMQYKQKPTVDLVYLLRYGFGVGGDMELGRA